MSVSIIFEIKGRGKCKLELLWGGKKKKKHETKKQLLRVDCLSHRVESFNLSWSY